MANVGDNVLYNYVKIDLHIIKTRTSKDIVTTFNYEKITSKNKSFRD